MKKSLIFAGLLAFALSTTLTNMQPAYAQPDAPCTKKEVGRIMPPSSKDFKAKKQAFDEKLKLTDEQKAQAKEIRLKGHEEMKPIMEKMKAKKAEIEKIKAGEGTYDEKTIQIRKVHKEMKLLGKEVRALRIKNMQEFEAILTPEQKQTLEKMKKEGRKNFKKHHQKRPPCKCDCNKK